MEKAITFLWVGLGGALGSMLRYGFTLLGTYFHLSGNVSTFFINVIGSFVLGFLSGKFSPIYWSMPFMSVGLCGGFTTFSTFSVQSVKLLQEGKWEGAFLYILGSIVTCILFAFIGYFLSTLRH